MVKLYRQGAGFGEAQYSSSGYGGQSRDLATDATTPTGGSSQSFDPLGRRGAADVKVWFKASGIEVQPLTFETRLDDGMDDWGRATFTRQAADVIKDGIIDFEPVDIYAEDTKIWRGFVREDSITVSKTDGELTMYDPIKVLDYGYVDKEYQKVNLGDIVEDILENDVHDPHGVLTGTIYPEANPNTTKLQHGKFFGVGANNGGGDLFELSATSAGVEDAIRDITPFMSGDGNLDFREETPLEAFREIAEVWDVNVFTTKNRKLAFGFEDSLEDNHGAGRGASLWRLRDFNVPKMQIPFGRVIVKGTTPTFSDGNQDWSGAPMRFLKSVDPANRYGWASYENYEGPVTVMEYTKSEDPATLQAVASRVLINKFINANQGSLTLDVLASDVGLEAIRDIRVGSYIMTQENDNCGIVGGKFRINGVRHIYDPKKGWLAELDVVSVIDDTINTGTITKGGIDPAEAIPEPSEVIDSIGLAPTPVRAWDKVLEDM